MDKAVEVIYKDLCEYYDDLRKKKTEKWLILAVINKNKQLIIDDIANDYPNLEINHSTFKKAFRKLEKEYDIDTDDNMVHVFGWKRVAFSKTLDVINGGKMPSEIDDEDDDELEKEMDAYNLDDEEKELVRKGDYDPWDFEYPADQDEMDDDDYYEEDDI